MWVYLFVLWVSFCRKFLVLLPSTEPFGRLPRPPPGSAPGTRTRLSSKEFQIHLRQRVATTLPVPTSSPQRWVGNIQADPIHPPLSIIAQCLRLNVSRCTCANDEYGSCHSCSYGGYMCESGTLPTRKSRHKYPLCKASVHTASNLIVI